VTRRELADYASQYRHFERYLPGFLERLVASLPEGLGRTLVAANLADEVGDPVPHVQLFERFAGALGAPETPPSAAMAKVLRVYDDLLAQGARNGLAGFLAYECQAAEVAQAKAEGLRRHYGLDAESVLFWAHHAEVDVRHAKWAQDAFDDEVPVADALEASVSAAADAWWEFLDEREVVRPAA
jgi:pyrroloquinoline quinone (PQQ) biosynthesis protein C